MTLWAFEQIGQTFMKNGSLICSDYINELNKLTLSYLLAMKTDFGIDLLGGKRRGVPSETVEAAFRTVQSKTQIRTFEERYLHPSSVWHGTPTAKVAEKEMKLYANEITSLTDCVHTLNDSHAPFDSIQEAYATFWLILKGARVYFPKTHPEARAYLMERQRKRALKHAQPSP